MLEAQRVIETFLRIKDSSENPIELFGGQMEMQVNSLIDRYLEEKSLKLTHLNREEKKLLVQHLYHKGVFNYKNAAPYLAKKLENSRASIYNYIKQI